MMGLRMVNTLIRKLGYCFVKIDVGKTRASTYFAKEYFKDKEINVVEVGVCDGVNANNILEELNVNKIYLVDPYGEEASVYYKKFIIKAEGKAHKLLRKYMEKVTWIKDFSKNVFNKVGRPDFIYIDGDHSYKCAKEDIQNYYKVLKGGGILAGDDIGIPNVSKAFWEFVIENKINKKNVHYSKSDWWIIKPKFASSEKNGGENAKS